MAAIDTYLQDIVDAVYGEEVRWSIHDAISAMNVESTAAEAAAISARNSATAKATEAAGSAQSASQSASSANTSAQAAAASAREAEQYAQGGLEYQATISFSQIPTSGMKKGWMYDINEDFTTDNRFEEGAGKFVKAGSNIAWNGSKWDVLAMGGMIVDTSISSTSTNPVQNKVINTALSNKVDKVSGKGLSTNDYDGTAKTKLDNLANVKSIGSGLNLNSTTGELSATGIEIPIDTALSTTSVNPVQNKVITSALNDKVDKVSGKGLSTNDYDGTAKTKLDNLVNVKSIGSGLNFNTTTGELSATGIEIPIDTELSSTSTNPVQNKVISSALSNKVDKVSGKGLSTNDYDTTSKTKLDNLANVKSIGSGLNLNSSTGALTASIDTALSATSVNPVQNKVITGAMRDSETIEGKNLVDYLHPLGLSNLTKTSAGVIQSNGTDTRAANFTFVGVKTGGTYYTAGDTYTVAANTHYERAITIQENTVLMIIGHNGATRDFKESISAPLPAGNYIFSFDMVGADTSTSGGYSFKNVMIRKATETDYTYEPYYIPLKDRLESSSGVPFRFGIDGNGNYGYIKDGADTVTPFKNPTGTKSDTYTTNGTYDVDVENYKTHRITVNVPSSQPTLTPLDCRGVRVIFEPFSKSESISYDWVDVIGHNGSSYVYGRVGGTSTWPDIVVPTHGQQYIYIYWKSDSSSNYWGFKIAAIVPAYCTAVQGQSSGTYSSLPRSYDQTVTLANARTIQTAHIYSVNEAYCWRIDISSLQTSTTASDYGYAKTIYIPTQASTSRTAETAIVPVNETISSAKTYNAGYYSNAWTVTPQGSSPSLGTKTVSPSTSQATYYASSDGYQGYSSVTVNAISPQRSQGNITIAKDRTFDYGWYPNSFRVTPFPDQYYKETIVLNSGESYTLTDPGCNNLFIISNQSASWTGSRITVNSYSTSGMWNAIGTSSSYWYGSGYSSDGKYVIAKTGTGTSYLMFILVQGSMNILV